MDEEKYYYPEVNNQSNVVEKRVELDRIYGKFGSFFAFNNIRIQCRDPPINLNKKIQVDRRIKNGRTPKKKKV